ncbi:MAG: GTPase [Eubacterium sp.]|nr:GTPase [Eubacterium sp.]
MAVVYFINGFLEAGKTTFIRDLLVKDYFKIDGRTLLIACEEGSVEYDEEELISSKTELFYIENEEDFNEDYIASLEKKVHPERIIIEFNGMWDRKNIEFPWYWEEILEVAVFDASTFKLYSDNLRSLLAEQVRNAGVVLFNRCDAVREQLGMFTRNIKAINRAVNFVCKGNEGDIILDPDETLPYDISSEELFLNDEGFAVFCIDSMERYGIYENKKVHFTARAYKIRDGKEFEFVSGRYVMTCCEADMSFVGIMCRYFKAYELKNKTWIDVTAVVKIAYDEDLKRCIPICKVMELEEVPAPQSEVISLI